MEGWFINLSDPPPPCSSGMSYLSSKGTGVKSKFVMFICDVDHSKEDTKPGKTQPGRVHPLRINPSRIKTPAEKHTRKKPTFIYKKIDLRS